jgi:hypothetical protein
MMSNQLEGADRALQNGVEALKDILDNVKPIHAIYFSMTWGVLYGIITTGWLGEESLDIWSYAGWMTHSNLILSLVFLAINITPTSRFVVKMLVAALIGYSLQWQVMAMIDPLPTFIPPIPEAGKFGLFLFFASMIGGTIYAIVGNDEYAQSSMSSEDMELFKEFKAAKSRGEI